MLSHKATDFPPIFPILKWIRFVPSRLLLWLKPKIKVSMARLENVKPCTVPLMVIRLVSPTLQ